MLGQIKRLTAICKSERRNEICYFVANGRPSAYGNMKTNYVIGTWSGSRTHVNIDGERWRWYIKHHLEHLNTLKHDLAQVTIGHPRNTNEAPEYSEYLSSLRNLDCGTPIQVLDVENMGRSYGQYSAAFGKDGGLFSHYIFIEDDYIPTLDYFDIELITVLQQMKNCDYLCSVAQRRSESGRWSLKSVDRFEHAAVSNGVCTSQTLRKVWEKFGDLPHGRPENLHWQKCFSRGFTAVECVIDDYLHKYSSLYMDHESGGIRIYGDPSKASIISPIQILWENGQLNQYAEED